MMRACLDEHIRGPAYCQTCFASAFCFRLIKFAEIEVWRCHDLFS